MVNILKSYPAKYVFAGYSVRQGLSVMMTNMNGKMVYDIFLYSYVFLFFRKTSSFPSKIP